MTIFQHQVTLTESIGYVAAMLVFSTFYMRTMLPLRLVAIVSNVAFIAYACLASLHPVLILHAILLPLNSLRLLQLWRLRDRVRKAASGSFSLEKLLPFMTEEARKAGEVLFHQGDRADRIYYVQAGSVTLVELGKALGAGDVMGEIGVFATDGIRTATAVCETDTVLLSLSREVALQHYVQNPEFGMHMIRLVTERLLGQARGAAQRRDKGPAVVRPLHAERRAAGA